MLNTILNPGSRHVDLTAHIQNITVDPIALGGFSDLYLGDLTKFHPPRKVSIIHFSFQLLTHFQVVIKVLRAHTYGKCDNSKAKKVT